MLAKHYEWRVKQMRQCLLCRVLIAFRLPVFLYEVALSPCQPCFLSSWYLAPVRFLRLRFCSRWPSFWTYKMAEDPVLYSARLISPYCDYIFLLILHFATETCIRSNEWSLQFSSLVSFSVLAVLFISNLMYAVSAITYNKNEQDLGKKKNKKTSEQMWCSSGIIWLNYPKQ